MSRRRLLLALLPLLSTAGCGGDGAPAGVDHDEAVTAFCDAFCGRLDACGELEGMTLAACTAGCAMDGPPDACVITQAELDACVDGASSVSCPTLGALPSAYDYEPPACADICADPTPGGDGGPMGVDATPQVAFCASYVSPTCSPDPCDGAFCDICNTLDAACDANPGACDAAGAGDPVACEVAWVECIQGSLNCGDPSGAAALLASCQSAYDACTAP